MVPSRFANGNDKPGNRLARAPVDKRRDRNYGRGRVRVRPPLHDWLSNVTLTESGYNYRDGQNFQRVAWFLQNDKPVCRRGFLQIVSCGVLCCQDKLQKSDVPKYNPNDMLNVFRKYQQNINNDMMPLPVGRGELCLLCQRYRCRCVKKPRKGGSFFPRARVAFAF